MAAAVVLTVNGGQRAAQREDEENQQGALICAAPLNMLNEKDQGRECGEEQKGQEEQAEREREERRKRGEKTLGNALCLVGGGWNTCLVCHEKGPPNPIPGLAPST